MSGRHRNDIPDGMGDGGYDPSRPVFGPANDGSSDWFGGRESAGRPLGHPQAGPPGGPPGGVSPVRRARRPSGSRPGGRASTPATGAAGTARSGGYPSGEPMSGGRQDPLGSSPSPLAGTGYSEYDSIRSSDGGSSSGYFGGSDGSGDSAAATAADRGAPGVGGSGGSGGDSGGYEYGGRRAGKRKRSATALIGPMAGAVGLALLLGVGVYAFAESGGCTGDDAMRLSVAAAPDIAPVVQKAAERFNDGSNEVDGKCVRADVKKVEPSSVSTLLSGQGVANAANERPDVWIPDSSLWISLAQANSDGKKGKEGTTASSPRRPRWRRARSWWDCRSRSRCS